MPHTHPRRGRNQGRIQRQPAHAPAPAATVEVVDPRWLLKMFALSVAVAALCGYAVVCWLFWHAQWQLVLHPSRHVDRTPASIGLAFQPVRFGPETDGQHALTGWWIPSGEDRVDTALVVHAGEGTMADALPLALALHGAGLNVLLFDPRGFGTSAGAHPTDQTVVADARTARDWLVQQRHIAFGHILPTGIGLGASVATTLANENSATPGIILLDARGDFHSWIVRENRSRLLPVGLLFNQDFPLAPPLHRLAKPKLLISFTSGPPPTEFLEAADPKQTVELQPGAALTAIVPQIHSFADEAMRSCRNCR